MREALLTSFLAVGFAAHMDVCPTTPLFCFGETCGVHLANFKLRPGCTCTPLDYAHTSTPCDDITRTRDIIFYWRPPATCRGGVDLPAPILGVPCDLDCGPGRFLNYNLTAQETDCDNCCYGVGQCDELSKEDKVGSCCPADATCCEHNDGGFTCCQFGTTCQNGDCVDVNSDPQETRMLRCEECPPGRSSLGGGMVFDPPWSSVPPQFSVECTSKTQGPCYPWKRADSGLYLETGDNWDVHFSTSVLTLKLEIVKKGLISFAYKYDAEERYDVFSFHLDNTAVLVVDKATPEWTWFNRSLDTGLHVFEWFYIKDGTTSSGQDKAFLRSIQIVGVFDNDFECDLCTPGRFMASSGARECQVCPAGRHSPGLGAVECAACHSWEQSTEGATTCMPDLSCTAWDTYENATPCVEGFRNVTSTWLEPRRCAVQDKAQNGEFRVGPNPTNETIEMFVPFFAPFTSAPRVFGLEAKQQRFVFDAGKQWDQFEIEAENITVTGFTLFVNRVNHSDGTWGQDLKVKWNAESNQGYALPASTRETCSLSDCGPGRQRVEERCEYCPPGKVWQQAKGCTDDCSKPGYGAATFISKVDTFLPGGEWRFKTDCQGECGTPGWRFGDTFADSGAAHSPGAMSRLSLDVSHTPDARITEVSFELLLSCAMMTGRLSVLMDEAEVARYSCEGCNNEAIPVRISALGETIQGQRTDHRISWVYSKIQLGATSHDCDFARIANITIISDTAPVARSQLSGATECLPCRAGFASPQAVCEQCEVGSFSSGQGSARCTPCEQGTFAFKKGATTCLSCGNQTSNNLRSFCLQNCQFGEKAKSYDIRALRATVPVSLEISNENTTASLFISACQAFHPNVKPRPTPTTSGSRRPKLPATEAVPSECGRLSDAVMIEADDEVDNRDLAVPPHVCVQLANGKLFSAGAIMNVQISPPDSPGATLRLQYTHGLVARDMDSRCAEGQRASTTITLFCDPAADPGSPQDVSTVEGAMCGQFQLLWYSVYGCHTCTEADMSSVDTACSPSGFLNRTYIVNEPRKCLSLGGLPTEAVIACDPLEGISTTHFVMSRILGFVLLGILVVLVLAIIGLEVRHRMLYSKYRSLSVEVELADGARVFNLTEGDMPVSAMDDDKQDDFSSDSGEEQ